MCLFVSLSFGGPLPDTSAVHQRLICVVPIVGSGTLDDPRRPEFAPVMTQANGGEPETKARKGFAEVPAIIAYHSVLSDDGKSAIVEFVAHDRAAFASILDARRQGRVQVFDRNNDKSEDVLAALRRVKAGFTFSMLRVGAL